jgi:hypothetical protein
MRMPKMIGSNRPVAGNAVITARAKINVKIVFFMMISQQIHNAA